MSIVYITSAAGSSAGSPADTASFDSTGGNFIIVADTKYTVAATACSDNKGNTYVPLTEEFNGAAYTRLFYCENANVGTGHVVTMTGAGYHGVVALVFSGVATASSFDAESAGGSGVGTSQQPGTLTPSENNCLLVTGLGFGEAISAQAINEGFSTIYGVNASGPLGTYISYKIQTTAAAQNPTWSWTTTRENAATMAAFKAGASGSAVPIIIQKLYR